MPEIWKDVPKKRYFQVSNLGRVRRLEMKDTMGRVRKERIIKQKNGSCLLGGVARLVLSAFVRLPKKRELGRHLDDNRENNHLSNLAWGYHQDNIDDAMRNKRIGRGTEASQKLSEAIKAYWKNLSVEERKKKSDYIRSRRRVSGRWI